MMKVRGWAILKWISNIISTLLIILLIGTVLILISARVTGGEPSFFGYQFKTVLSGSMEPEIQTGSIIVIKLDGDTKNLEKGDVITFRTKDNILVTHRITQVNGEGQQFITKGDNNDGPDMEPVIADNIVGQYTGFTVPYVGYLANFLNTKLGSALVLILPGVLLLGYSFFSITRTLIRLEAGLKKGSTGNFEQVATLHKDVSPNKEIN